MFALEGHANILYFQIISGFKGSNGHSEKGILLHLPPFIFGLVFFLFRKQQISNFKQTDKTFHTIGPQIPLHSILELHKASRSPDFEALKTAKVSVRIFRIPVK